MSDKIFQIKARLSLREKLSESADSLNSLSQSQVYLWFNYCFDNSGGAAKKI